MARASVLEGNTHEESLAHTEECTQCAARLKEERALLAGVRAVVEDIAGETAPMRVEAALLLALHERSSSNLLRMPEKIERTRWIWGAAAAAILALITTVLVSWLHAGSIDKDNAAREHSFGPAAPTIPPAQQVIATIERPADVASNTHRTRTRRRSIRRDEKSGGEIATAFLPLLEGDDLDSLDSSQLVRVELPGSALIAVGLPIDAEMANAPVKADILLGHDGLARAIRFVR